MKQSKFVETALKKVSQGKVILDIGGGEPSKIYSPEISRALLANNYISLNKALVGNPDLIADCHHLPFKSNSIDSVICKAVLEHVENPIQAASEIYRILKKEGACYRYVPFLYPYHPAKHYEDYFRFTKDGVKLLLKDFSTVKINPSRGYFGTLVRLLPKQLGLFLNPIATLLDRLIPLANQNSGWDVLAIK